MHAIDRYLRPWLVWSLNLLALGWFATLVMQGARWMPGIQTSRCPIGMCLAGYEPQVARSFFSSLGTDGRQNLARLISTSDLVLPVLVMIALAATLLYYTRSAETGGRTPLSGGWRAVLLMLPLLYVLADYAENVVVLRMLAHPDQITDRLAHAGSLLTAAKSQMVIAAITFAAAFVVAAWLDRRRG